MTHKAETTKRSTLRLYTPHDGQRQIHRSKSRFNIVCFGRQSGKTTYGLNKIADSAWRGSKDGIYWYVLQTYDAAQVAFKRMRAMYIKAPRAFAKRPNESDLSCQFHHGPMIHFKSGKNYEDLRVETLDGVVIDEYRQQNQDLWPMVIRPMLAKKSGWADVLSTPNGFEHFYDLFETAKLDNQWSWFHAPSTIAPWWTEAEIASARSSMSEAEFAQEIMAEFREMGVGKVYLNHGTHNHMIENPFAVRGYDWAPHLPIILSCDFNVGLMCWHLSQVKGNEGYTGFEFAVSNTNTAECIRLVIDKVKGHRAGVEVIGDASGRARKTSSNETDYQIIMSALRGAGIEARNLTPESNPSVKDRVNVVNSALKSADGVTRYFYNPVRCPVLKRDFERVTWKSGSDNAIFDKSDPMLTHASDDVGYLIYNKLNDLKSRPGKMGVIFR